MMETVTLRAFEAAALAGIRPSWCLAAASAAAAAGWVDLPPPLDGLASWTVFGALLVVVALEHFAERDVDLSRLLVAVRFGLAGGAAWVSSAALATYGERPPEWLEQAGGIVVALAVAFVREALRRKLLELAQDAGDPAKWLARTEEIMLVVGIVLLIFAPVVLLGWLVLMAMGAMALLLAARMLDRRARRPCPACAHPARNEAQRCPGCGGELTPLRFLQPPAPMAARLRLASPSPSALSAGDRNSKREDQEESW